MLIKMERGGERTAEFFLHILFKKAKRSYQEFQTICINVPLIVNSPSLTHITALPACSGFWRTWDQLRCSLVHNRKRTAVQFSQVEVYSEMLKHFSWCTSGMACGDRNSYFLCLKIVSSLLKLRLLGYFYPASKDDKSSGLLLLILTF